MLLQNVDKNTLTLNIYRPTKVNIPSSMLLMTFGEKMVVVKIQTGVKGKSSPKVDEL